MNWKNQLRKKFFTILFLVIVFFVSSNISYSQEVDPELKVAIAYNNGNVSESEALAALRITERDIEQLKSLKFPVNYFNDKYVEAKDYFDGMDESQAKREQNYLNKSGQKEMLEKFIRDYNISMTKYGKYGFDYEKVIEIVDQLKLRKSRIISINDELEILEKTIESQKELYQYDYSSVDVMYGEALSAFHEESLDVADEKIKKIKKEIEDIRFESSSLKILSETYYQKLDYATITYIALSILALIFIFSFFGRKLIIKRKIRNLRVERETIKKLMIKLQSDYFKDKNISRDTYKSTHDKYNERLLEIEEKIPVYQDQLKSFKLKNKDNNKDMFR